MREEILEFVKSANRPVNMHEIAAAIRREEMEVTEVLESMEDDLFRIIVPLSEHVHSSLYYRLHDS